MDCRGGLNDEELAVQAWRTELNLPVKDYGTVVHTSNPRPAEGETEGSWD